TGGSTMKLAVLILAASVAARAEELPSHFRVMAGLTQWTLLRGGNVAAEIDAGRFAFEVSHGQGLDLNQLGGAFMTSSERGAQMRLYVPWTTGFGVGFRFTDDLHVLVEFKAHRFEASGTDLNARVAYTTY